MNLEPIRELAKLKEAELARLSASQSGAHELAYRIRMASPALSQLLEAVTWIKCSERMPEDCHRVMLCHPQADGYKWVLYGHWQAASDAWNVQGDSGLHGRDFITHWMPLPSPPEDK